MAYVICPEYYPTEYFHGANKKWALLYPNGFVSICQKGCHGTHHNDFSSALAETAAVQSDCDSYVDFDDDMMKLGQ